MTAAARQLEREDKGGIAQEGVSDAKNRFFSPLRLRYITLQILARLQRAWCHPPERMRPPQALPLRLPGICRAADVFISHGCKHSLEP
jgi:hypothetical protein